MMSILTIPIQHSTGSSAHWNKAKIRNKQHIFWKGRNKTIFIDDMTVSVKTPQESKKNLLELTSKFSKVTRYKISKQKWTALLYTDNEHVETEIKNTRPFIIIAKKIKYLGVHLKHVQDLCAENYKMLMKEIKEDLNLWRAILCSWIGTLNRVKMSFLPNLIYSFFKK